jgi:hypothetical protein
MLLPLIPSSLSKFNNVLEIPLEIHGVISHIRTQLPTNEELENYRQGLL